MRFKTMLTALTGLLAAGVLSAAPAQAATNAKIDAPGGSAVNLRGGPGTQYGVTGSANSGSWVTIVCTTKSEPVSGKWGSSTIWDKLSNGSWVADAFVYTGVSGAVEPECPATGRRPAGDDYPYKNGDVNLADRWAMYIRQCTSFVAWRMEQVNGYFHNNMWRNGIAGHWGNAYEWNDNAIKLGYPVDHTPRAGAIAQFEPGVSGASSAGHVAYISAVNGSTVTIEEYNWSAYRYTTRQIPANSISNVIHFAAGT
ncbi:Surface antigen [Amycolatopsis xylanica]|uniref:Surface antigen n=1 Tax=Amycolatopsis xylanica TaxID=589385 RepID=A0A1H3NS30_9PSEU|nr:CHAP domain-containing protein [Amycolatopsis xylanica]SDY90989.1 Surface antigen [Amycolatopsis xylanica]